MVIYLFAAVAPLITIDAGVKGAVEAEGLIALPLAVAVDGPSEPVTSPMKYILMVYIIGVVLMALRFVADTCYLLYLKITAERVRINGVEVKVHGNEKLSPFSWAGEIFIPGSMVEMPSEELKLIISHEQSHLVHRHWLDLVVSNLAIVLQWYNPAAWLLHGELIKVHEFDADRHVLDSTGTVSEYQLLLIKRTAGSRFHTIADSLNHSSLKNRITMMMKNQTKSRARLRALAMLPVVAVALCLTNSSCVKSACDKAEAEDKTEAAATSLVDEAAKPSEKELEEMKVVAYRGNPDDLATSATVVAVQAEYPGGYEELYRMLAETINFVGDEGKVLVGFTIDKEGNLCNPHIIKGISEAANNEAIRVVKALEKWTPAKDEAGNAVASKFVLPINFVISKAPGNCNKPQQ